MVAEQGTYEQLRRAQGAVAKLHDDIAAADEHHENRDATATAVQVMAAVVCIGQNVSGPRPGIHVHECT